MLLNHCKKWNLETHMTFVDVRLIEETTEYRFVLLKNYMGWSIWSKHFSVCLRQGVHLIWNSEAKSASCSQKTGWNSKKRRGLGGEGHHPCPSSDPCSAYWPIFSPFSPHCGPWTQTIKFSMPLIFFPKESQTEALSCSWLVSKSEQKQGVRWGNSEVLFIHYPRQNWVNRALLRSTQGLDLNTAINIVEKPKQQGSKTFIKKFLMEHYSSTKKQQR